MDTTEMPTPHGWDEPKDPRPTYRLGRVAFFLGFVGFGLFGLNYLTRAVGILTRNWPLMRVASSPGWERLIRLPSFALILASATILLGRWPDRVWRIRSTWLVVLSALMALPWAIDQAEVLGLPPAPAELKADTLKMFASAVLGCLVLPLMAGAASDVCEHLGLRGTDALRRPVRLASAAAAGMLGVVIAAQIDWAHGWPFQAFAFRDHETFLLFIGSMLARVAASVFVGLLCLRACALCARELALLEHAHREDDPFAR